MTELRGLSSLSTCCDNVSPASHRRFFHPPESQTKTPSPYRLGVQVSLPDFCNGGVVTKKVVRRRSPGPADGTGTQLFALRFRSAQLRNAFVARPAAALRTRSASTSSTPSR